MKRHITLALTLVFTLLLSGCTSTSPAQAEIYAMDTVMNITAYGGRSTKAAAEVKALLTTLDTQLSRTRADSEVSRLNSTGSTEVSEDTARLLRQAGEYSAATDGAFDITIAPVADLWGFTGETHRVPTQAELAEQLPLVDHSAVTLDNHSVTLKAGQAIDLGGIAKGYAADRIAECFSAHHVRYGLAELGGSIYAHGTKPEGSAWRIGVQDPLNTAGYLGVLSLADAFAITSGGYQRYFQQEGITYHHILDPLTGSPANSGLLSVTVTASAAPEHGAMCDAFSTALFVMGEEAALRFWRSSSYDFQLVLVTEDRRVLITAGLENTFEPTEGSGYTYEIIR